MDVFASETAPFAVAIGLTLAIAFICGALTQTPAGEVYQIMAIRPQ